MRFMRLLFPIAFVAGGCGDAGIAGRAPEAVVRDSAGVTIVENPAPSDATPVWRVADEPSLDIGVVEGAAEYQLERVHHAARLSDGRIVVADGGAASLRFYDAEGRHLTSAGRKGGGPGEFEGLGQAFVGGGDSIYVWDWNLSRMSVFAPTGAFSRTFTLAAPAAAAGTSFPIAIFDDGDFLAMQRRAFTPESRGGVYRDTLVYLRYSAEGQPIDTVGQWPGAEAYVESAERRVSVMSLGLGRDTHFAFDSAGLYVGDSARPEVALYGADGLERIVRFEHATRAVTPEDIEAYKRAQLESAEEQWREFQERMLNTMPFPETMPAFRRVISDERGNLWVQRYDPVDDVASEWQIFGDDGVLAAVATTPAHFWPMQIGEDWLLGRWRDEMGVEHVRMYHFARGDS